LRRGEGRGGSPTEYDQTYIEREDSNSPGKNSQQMIPVRKNNMSVRVRAKDASYVYGSGSINDVGNPKMQSTAG